MHQQARKSPIQNTRRFASSLTGKAGTRKSRQLSKSVGEHSLLIDQTEEDVFCGRADESFISFDPQPLLRRATGADFDGRLHGWQSKSRVNHLRLATSVMSTGAR